MEKCKIEYVRRNNEKKKSKGHKKGVLFCNVDETDGTRVNVGFSLCSPLDDFDIVGGERDKNFGLGLAETRALKWRDHQDYFVQNSFTEESIQNDDIFLYSVPSNIVDPNGNKYTVVMIPPSIVKKFHQFIERCKRYYQDKTFPVWVEKFLTGAEFDCTLMERKYY